MRALSIFIAFLLVALCGAQNIDQFDAETAPSRESVSASANTSQPVILAEISIRQNEWRPYLQDAMLAGLMADIAERAGFALGFRLEEALEEVWAREAFTSGPAQKWVRQGSPRLAPQTIEPATIRFEMVCGGSSAQGSDSIRLGRDRLDLESGKAVAEITLTIRDMVTGRVISTIRARGERSSTNLEAIRIAERWSWRGRGFPGFSYEKSGTNPAVRRGYLAVEACFLDLERKLIEEVRRGRLKPPG